MASAALRGFVLGLAIAATPGPMFFLCLRRTLLAGWRSGLAAGLGIATADTIYAAVAAAGVGAAGALLGGAEPWIALAGGIALLGLGLATAIRRQEPRTGSIGGSYAATLLLTLANPATILAFAAVFAGVGLAGLPRSAVPVVVAGTALGSLSWWLILIAVAGRIGAVVGPRLARPLGLVSGLAIAAFGAAAIVAVLR